jgi:uncharacterized protein YydD (DUF2326 family)
LKEADTLQNKLDSKLQYLGAHKALDIFVKLNNKLVDLKNQKDNLQRSDKLREEYQSKSLKLKEELIKLTEQAHEHLKDVNDMVNIVCDFFRDLAKRVYPNAVSGITIKNDDGENQTMFDVQAKIQEDGSDGISNVKIFCYDMTILFKGLGGI